MKKIYRYTKIVTARAATMLIAVCTLTGCEKDYAVDYPAEGSAEAVVEFSIRVPGAALPSTRALSIGDESAVKTVDILAFGSTGGNYLYHRRVTQVTGENKFSVLLPRSDEQVRFVFLANSTAILEAAYGTGEIPAADDYDQLWSKLIKSSGAWNVGSDYDPLPMWGEAVFAVTNSTVAPQIPMVRMLARINVSSSASDFILQEVRLYNPMSRGYLIPEPSNWSADSVKVSRPSVSGLGERINGWHEYDLTGETDFKNRIYTFETTAGEKKSNVRNTFLVVGGTFKGQKTWFRIDIAVPSDADPEKYIYLPVLRNHKYDFTIRRIERAGYSTPEEAAAAPPINSDVELLVENDLSMYYAWNEDYYLGLETNKLYYAWWSGEDRELMIKTDYPEWTATVVNAASTPWLRLGSGQTTYSASGSDQYLPLNLLRQDAGNLGGAGQVTVTAGDLSLTLEIGPESIAKIFAKSNVLIGPERLIFAVSEEDNEVIPANVVGTLFRYGSLVGVNLGGRSELTLSSVVYFYPKEFGKPTQWSAIPYHQAYGGDVENEFERAFGNMGGYSLLTATGDVCRYISAQNWVEGYWRIPTEKELNLLFNTSDFKQATGTFLNPWGNILSDEYYGMYEIYSGWWVGRQSATSPAVPTEGTIFLPAPGFRGGDGMRQSDGSEGNYWSATTGSATHANSFNINKTNAGSTTRLRGEAHPVRCIRDLDYSPSQYYINADPLNVAIKDKGESAAVTVRTNAPSWSFTVKDGITHDPVDWITFTNYQPGQSVPGNTGGTILQYTVARNTEAKTRYALINITTSDGIVAAQQRVTSYAPFYIESDPVHGSVLQAWYNDYVNLKVSGERPEIKIQVQERMDTTSNAEFKIFKFNAGLFLPAPDGSETKTIHIGENRSVTFTRTVRIICTGTYNDPQVFEFVQQPGSNYLLPSGRILAKRDVSTSHMDWTAAMGISNIYSKNYFYTSYGSRDDVDNRYYNPAANISTGCAGYYETTADIRQWRLPTMFEVREIGKAVQQGEKFGFVPSYTDDHRIGYWSSSEDVNGYKSNVQYYLWDDKGGLWGSGSRKTQESSGWNISLVRCVRER